MMVKPEKYIRLHPRFKINGESYSIETLKAQAHHFIKEGEPYQESVGNFIIEWLNDRKYILVNTSGSTGTPKMMKVKKIHMVQSAKATGKHFKVAEKTKALLCLPAQFIAGKMMLVRALVLGWHIDMTQPTSNPLDNVFRRYDFCAMTPFQLDNSLSRLHLLSKLIVGGGPVPPTLLKRLQKVSTKIYETYGMTETVSHIAARRINAKKVKEDPVPFKTLNKVTIETDQRGCLIVKAPNVSSDPVITNDLVKKLTYKKFIWLGRIDNVINSGGIKLHPEQIERKLAPAIDVPFFVAGIPDEQLGERLVLIVEKDSPYPLSLDDYEPEDFDPYEFPKEVIAIKTFQRTDNGKLKRGQTLRTYLINK